MTMKLARPASAAPLALIRRLGLLALVSSSSLLLAGCVAEVEDPPATTDTSGSASDDTTNPGSSTTSATGSSDATGPTSTTQADGSSDDGTTDTDTDGIEVCAEPTLETCCCFDVDETVDRLFDDPIVYTCEDAFAPLCDPLVLGCSFQLRPGPGVEQCAVPDATIQSGDIQCVLQALIDRAPGTLQIVSDVEQGVVEASTTLFVSGDDAITWFSGDYDLIGYAGPVTRGTLRPVADFEACLADPDLVSQLDCLYNPLAEPGAEVCIQGTTHDLGR